MVLRGFDEQFRLNGVLPNFGSMSRDFHPAEVIIVRVLRRVASRRPSSRPKHPELSDFDRKIKKVDANATCTRTSLPPNLTRQVSPFTYTVQTFTT